MGEHPIDPSRHVDLSQQALDSSVEAARQAFAAATSSFSSRAASRASASSGAITSKRCFPIRLSPWASW